MSHLSYKRVFFNFLNFSNIKNLIEFLGSRCILLVKWEKNNEEIKDHGFGPAPWKNKWKSFYFSFLLGHEMKWEMRNEHLIQLVVKLSPLLPTCQILKRLKNVVVKLFEVARDSVLITDNFLSNLATLVVDNCKEFYNFISILLLIDWMFYSLF